MEKKYYWLGSYPLEEGSVVLPGNWGRIIKNYTYRDNVLTYLQEEIFENVRKNEFPNLPSRLTSTFVCDSEASLKHFQEQNSRSFDIPYEVILLDDKPMFETDWMLATIPSYPIKLRSIEEMAKRYWNPEKIVSKEILTESRIKIVRRL